jgi:hypothetical protein
MISIANYKARLRAGLFFSPQELNRRLVFQPEVSLIQFQLIRSMIGPVF